MADLFAGIFNNIENSLGDWIGTGLNAVLNPSSSKKQEEGLDSLISTLGKADTPNAYKSSQSQAVKSEDPFAFEQVWKSRFKSFLE